MEMDSESSGQATPISELEPWPHSAALDTINVKSLGSTNFIWTINSFSALSSKEISPEFSVGGFKW
jgi:hypothetical protein